jgi:short-subunit dehydrogenase
MNHLAKLISRFDIPAARSFRHIERLSPSNRLKPAASLRDRSAGHKFACSRGRFIGHREPIGHIGLAAPGYNHADMSLAGKTIVVTGASAGIGQELARQLAHLKANLALAARNEQALDATQRRCVAAGAATIAVATDVTVRDDCRRLIERTVDRFGRIDVLVNNAGISMYAPFDQVTDLGLFERVLAVNYLGAVYCTHFALPHLKQSRGLLVAISSLQGKTGFPNSTAYAASKHAMQGFFDSLRIELVDGGVDVLVVSPGPVATQIHTHRLGHDGKLSAESRQRPNDAGMAVEECARQITRAIQKRRRELVMTASGKAGQWLKLMAPAWTDRIVARAVERFYRRH